MKLDHTRRVATFMVRTVVRDATTTSSFSLRDSSELPSDVEKGSQGRAALRSVNGSGRISSSALHDEVKLPLMKWLRLTTQSAQRIDEGDE